MDNFGNIGLSILVFFVALVVFYLILRTSTITKKKLGIIDLVWQSTLLFGLIFATIEVRKHQNTWQFEQNNQYTEYWYNNLIRDLTWDESNLERMHKRAVAANWESKDEYVEAISWIKDKRNLLESRKDIILKEHDQNNWIEIKSKLSNFIDTEARLMNGNHKYYLQCADNISNGLKETIQNKNKLEFSDAEGFFFYTYPWLLSLILGLRLSKTIYTTFHEDRILASTAIPKYPDLNENESRNEGQPEAETEIEHD